MNILSYLKSKLTTSEDKKNNNKGTATYSTIGSTSTSDKLKELEDFADSVYGEYVTDSGAAQPPKYERFEYEAPSDEEIKSSAESELGDYLNKGKSSIENEYAQKAKELSANKEASAGNLESSKTQLKSAYDEAAEVLSNDALKRGLARSSIAMNNQAAASKAYTDKLGDLIEQHNQRVSAIDEELNGLEGQLQNALDSFKIAYAAKLTQRINELKEEREKNRQEAIKYNNSLMQQEYKERRAAEKDGSYNTPKTIEEIKKSMSVEDKLRTDKEIYEKAAQLLESMPFEQARETFFGSEVFKKILSDYYYYTLYYKYR